MSSAPPQGPEVMLNTAAHSLSVLTTQLPSTAKYCCYRFTVKETGPERLRDLAKAVRASK